MSDQELHVLVVDDSAVVRETVSRLLGRVPGWRVSTALDSVIALERIRTDPPDVVLLDLEMPRMDGLTLLRHIMATDPLPVVVCSGFADHGTEAALAALELGAVEIFPKPQLSVREFLEDSGASLIAALRRAGSARAGVRRAWHPRGRRNVPSLVRGEPIATAPQGVEANPADGGRPPSSGPEPDGRVVLIGASMGGTEAIREVLVRFPEGGPPCLVVIHMPAPYTAAFARRLDSQVAMEVREAVEGDALVPGRVLVAPGGRHMRLSATRGRSVVELVEGQACPGPRPSIDQLFRTAAETLGRRAVAALLTGMGEDGAEGLLAVRRAGGHTLAQDEGTSTVFGMPRAAIDRGAAEDVLPLGRIGGRLIELVGTPVPPVPSRCSGPFDSMFGVGNTAGDERQ